LQTLSAARLVTFPGHLGMGVLAGDTFHLGNRRNFFRSPRPRLSGVGSISFLCATALRSFLSAVVGAHASDAPRPSCREIQRTQSIPSNSLILLECLCCRDAMQEHICARCHLISGRRIHCGCGATAGDRALLGHAPAMEGREVANEWLRRCPRSNGNGGPRAPETRGRTRTSSKPPGESAASVWSSFTSESEKECVVVFRTIDGLQSSGKRVSPMGKATKEDRRS
jgi:hypothetical protein